MTDMLVFSFRYKERFYKAIANLWQKSTKGLYRITVMNGDLERMLFGNNIVSLKEGRFMTAEASAEPEIKQLQEALVIALNDQQGEKLTG
ncbi:MAG TPA: hypothetical protein VM488_00435 [Pseudobacter sp.]|nr:hypothetical protein [Pseudobacter sp.]